MCGIVGWVGHGHEIRLEGEQALRVLSRRGPDGSNIWIDPLQRVGLGNTRLAILDLRAEAGQPMSRGELRITHNGETYNFVELRAQLEDLGETFNTTSDTEVPLAAYARW